MIFKLVGSNTAKCLSVIHNAFCLKYQIVGNMVVYFKTPVQLVKINNFIPFFEDATSKPEPYGSHNAPAVPSFP